MSEFLDRLLNDVRERLAASREAVREYEQLERALAALDGVDNDGAPPHPSARRSTVASARGRRRRSGAARPASRSANRDRLWALVGERPGVTREELETATGFSTAVVAQNLRRMVARGDLREQQLPVGQTGYATSSVDPDAARPTTGDGIQGDPETGRAADPGAAEDR